MACPMSGCLASGHFLVDVWLFSFLFFFFGGGGGGGGVGGRTISG